MEDIQEISEEHDLEEPTAELRQSHKLKEKLLDHFGDRIQFTKMKTKMYCTPMM